MFDLFNAKAPTRRRAPVGERLKDGLARSREKIAGGARRRAARRNTLDDATLEAIESALLGADVRRGRHRTADRRPARALEARGWRCRRPQALLQGGADRSARDRSRRRSSSSHARPFVIMLAGVNGAGKTTSIGKLAKHFQSQGLSVLLAAGDTFRAAAREQLDRLGRAQRRRGHRAAGRRSGRRNVRRDRRREGARHRRRAGRHRRTPADPAPSDGRNPQGAARDPQGRPGGAARDAARARRQHRPERASRR